MKGPTLFFLVMVLLTSVGAVADESDQDLPAPFTLTSRQQAEVDQVLRHWAQGATGVKLFEWSFTRWEYDSVFSPTDKAKSIDQGAMKYAPPNRWMYRLDGPRAEHWTCDGR